MQIGLDEGDDEEGSFNLTSFANRTGTTIPQPIATPIVVNLDVVRDAGEVVESLGVLWQGHRTR